MRFLGVFLVLVLSPWVLAGGIHFSGKLQQGGHIMGQVPAGSQLFLNDKPVLTDKKGYWFVGFGRDNKKQEVLRLETPEGDSIKQVLNIAPQDYNIQRVEGVAKKFNKPKPDAVIKRIRKENAAIKKARSQRLPLESFRETFQWPLIGPITGVFGSQRVYNGAPGRPHYGVDVAAPTGTKVVAPASGMVTLAHADMYYSGGTLLLDHGYGLSSSFLHLSKVLVKEGQTVNKGEVIGEVGAGGRATGAHLDWRMNWLDRRIDPTFFVPPMPKQAK